MDASITDSPRRPRGRKKHLIVEDRHEDDNAAEAEQAYLAEKDKANVNKDARWVRQAGRLRLEYKRHTVIDINGLILAEETTAANESDMKYLPNISHFYFKLFSDIYEIPFYLCRGINSIHIEY